MVKRPDPRPSARVVPKRQPELRVSRDPARGTVQGPGSANEGRVAGTRCLPPTLALSSVPPVPVPVLRPPSPHPRPPSSPPPPTLTPPGGPIHSLHHLGGSVSPFEFGDMSIEATAVPQFPEVEKEGTRNICVARYRHMQLQRLAQGR